MTTIFYVNAELSEPEAVECELVGYPNRDAKGRTQFENTHYATIERAWKELDSNHRAWQHSVSRDLVQANAEVASAKDELAKVCTLIYQAEQKRKGRAA
jgi:hypothetical protein